MTAALLPRRAAVSLTVPPAAVSFDAAAAPAAATPDASSAGALNEGPRVSLSPSQLSSRSPLCSKHWRYSPALLRPPPLAEGVGGAPPPQQDTRGPARPFLSPPSAPPLDNQRGTPEKRREAREGDSPVAVAVYLAGYLLASPLLSLCNKRLYGGPAKDLGLTCCLLQQLILCCCLLLCNSQPQQPLKPQQQQKEQQEQQKRVVSRQETGAALVSVSCRQQLQLACPYVLMLWSSNACLAVSSLASYQIARCSSIPIALLLEVLAVSSHEPSPSAAATAAAAAAAAEAAKGGARQVVPRVGETLRALRIRAAAVGGLRAFSALAVAAGLAAAAADGDSLQPHAAFLGVIASAAGAVYLQLASSCFRIRAQAPAAVAATPAAAAAVAVAAAATPKAAVSGELRPAAAAGGDERWRQEIAVAQRIALLSILLLLPVVALSQEPQQLLLRLQQQQRQQQQEVGVGALDLLLLIVSGCLAAVLPLCTYGCLRGLSPLACCVAGFTKMAAQMLLSPWLAKETLSVSTAVGCCCCLVGSLAFCLSSHTRLRANPEKNHKQR